MHENKFSKMLLIIKILSSDYKAEYKIKCVLYCETNWEVLT